MTGSLTGRRVTIASRIWTVVATLLVALAVVSSSGAAGAPPDLAAATASADVDSAGERLTVADATLELEDTSSVTLMLTEASNGLAGFEVTLAVDDVARVTDADYPDAFAMTTDPAVDEEGRTVTVEAVDLRDEIEPGDRNVTLATIELEGVADGTAEIGVTDFQVDADGGAAVEPALESGTVTVGSTESDDGSDDASEESDESSSENETTESDSSDSSGLDELGTGPALGIVATLSTLLVVARRVRHR